MKSAPKYHRPESAFRQASHCNFERYRRADYVSRAYYEEDEDIKKAVDFIVSDEMKAAGCTENLERLYHELLNKD